MLKYIVLGLLSYRPMSGYDIQHWMGASTGHFWHATLTQVYTTLKKLEAEGLADSHIEPGTDRPDRRVYRLTESGRADFKRWQASVTTDMEVKKDSLLVKLFFAAPEDVEGLLTQLRVQVTLHRQQREAYERNVPQAMMAFLSDQPELMPNAELWELTRQYGIRYEETYLEWLHMAIQFLEARHSSRPTDEHKG
ncbi:MAG: PadR family transcriptional regulator [Anaerolineae bacterium]